MKREAILLVFVLMSVLTAGAQKEVLNFIGKSTLIPGEFTADGKARMCVRVKQNDGSYIYNIYNTKMELETTFKSPTATYSVTRINETATVFAPDMYNIDISTATWTTVSSETQTKSCRINDIDDIYNMDTNNIMTDCDISVTQTLFNNDEEWEFVLTTGDTNETIMGQTTYNEDSKTATAYRVRTVSTQGLDIYNQNGQKLYSIVDKNNSSLSLYKVLIAEGKKYISVRGAYTTLDDYLYNVYLVNDSGLVPVNPGVTSIRGDVNNDGAVGMPDAMFIVNKILNGKFPDE